MDIYNLKIGKNIELSTRTKKETLPNGKGKLSFNANEIFHKTALKETCISLANISSVTIENNDKLQIYNKKQSILYQFSFMAESALKWQDCITETIQHLYNHKPNTC